ncbi:MAG: sensor histidine kinase [Bacillota bacterium]
MTNTSNKIENLIRFLIIVIVFINGSFTINDLNLRLYILLVLLFTLVCQIRLNFISNSTLFLASLFLDVGIIFYIHHQFGGFSYFLIYITLVDSLIFLNLEAYLLSLIISGFLTYFLKNKSTDIIFLNIIVFFLAFTFAKQIKKLRDSLTQIESLYDMNRNYSYELEEAKKRVENFAKMVEKVSQLEERNRISREIHDSAGHKLTGILMQLEAYIKLYEIDPVKSKGLIQSVRDNLRQCTELLRHTVKGIKPKEYTNKMFIQQMITSFEKTTGIKVYYLVKGMQYKLSPAVETVIYKNIQEALTNSVRHGKASIINIELKYFDDKIELIISDNGIGCDKIFIGMGISGMEERARILGGKVEFHSLNGFVVKTVIPINLRQVI